MKQILQGMRVVEGSAFVAAPSGGMTLAQLGAEVIRFDPIGGGLDFKRLPVDKNGTSLYWASLNKGKKSLAVDIRSDHGRELIRGLLACPGPDNGIFLTNFPAAGWMAYDALKTARDDLIMVNIKSDPKGGAGVDYTINCAVGFPFVTGPKGTEVPVNHVLPAWDVATGLYAVNGVLAADRFRSRTGKGQYVSVALSDVAFATAANLGYVADMQINGAGRGRGGNELYGAFGRDFKTKDGRYVMITAITSRQWRSLVETTGIGDAVAQLEAAQNADFNDEGQRYAAQDEISKLIEPWCANLTFAEAGAALEAGRVLWGPYRTFSEALAEDPRFSLDNPMFQDVHQPGIGAFMMPGIPLDFSEIARGQIAPAPLLGEHTDEILSDWLGLGDGEIGKLHDDGIVAGPAN